MRSAAFLLLSAFLLSVAASLSPAAASSTASAGKYVESLGNEAITIIANAKFSKQQKQSKLEKIFSSNVDIPWVGRFVMGRFWRQASPQQQKDYLKAYESFIITHYASRFAEYSAGTFNITGTRDDGDREFTVSMEMLSEDPSAPPVLVDYRVRNSDGRFKVFDVIVEGVSMITTQRSEFSSVINDKGIDHLIVQLSSKSLKPAAGK